MMISVLTMVIVLAFFQRHVLSVLIFFLILTKVVSGLGLTMMIIHDVRTSQASSGTSWTHQHLVYNRLLKFNHVVGVGQFYGSPALTSPYLWW